MSRLSKKGMSRLSKLVDENIKMNGAVVEGVWRNVRAVDQRPALSSIFDVVVPYSRPITS
jgi:hypothetical protein